MCICVYTFNERVYIYMCVIINVCIHTNMYIISYIHVCMNIYIDIVVCMFIYIYLRYINVMSSASTSVHVNLCTPSNSRARIAFRLFVGVRIDNFVCGTKNGRRVDNI